MRETIVAAILEMFPDAQMDEPSFISVTTLNYSIEFGIGADDPVMGVALHIRGDDSVVPLIVTLLERLNARAFDTMTGDFFDPSTAIESFRQWRAYKESVR